MVAMRTERFLSISLALAAIGYPAAGYANGNHLGWCHGVGNLQHSTGCAGLPTIGPHPSVPTPSVNSVAENQNSYLVPPLPPMARPNLVPQAIPQPSLPPQRTPGLVPQPQAVPRQVPATPQAIPQPSLPPQRTPGPVPQPQAVPRQVPATPQAIPQPSLPPQRTPGLVPQPQAVPRQVPATPQAIPQPSLPPQRTPGPVPQPQAVPRQVSATPQAIPQPSLPPQRTPSMTLGTARVPVMSSLGATSQRLTKPLDPLSLIVPMPGRQQAGQFHRTIHPEIGQTGHNVCLVSGYGRRRTSEVGHEVGLTLGFHLTDAIVRELPFDRHLYAGCFIVVERRWHRDHSD